jgi:hypothetical protein
MAGVVSCGTSSGKVRIGAGANMGNSFKQVFFSHGDKFAGRHVMRIVDREIFAAFVQPMGKQNCQVFRDNAAVVKIGVDNVVFFGIGPELDGRVVVGNLYHACQETAIADIATRKPPEKVDIFVRSDFSIDSIAECFAVVVDKIAVVFCIVALIRQIVITAVASIAETLAVTFTVMPTGIEY